MSVAVAPARTITAEEQATVQAMLARARAAMRAVEAYDQAAVDRLCRAIAWAGGNEETATRLAKMSVEESGMGSPEPKRRAKVQGILRDALRQKSMGVIEEIRE
jgi:sulfoacetaldehyde dehydrogenase